MSHEGFALWSLHIEDGMSTILEDVPISDFKRPIVPSDDNGRGVRTRWSAEQQALHDEQIFRYDSRIFASVFLVVADGDRVELLVAPACAVPREDEGV